MHINDYFDDQKNLTCIQNLTFINCKILACVIYKTYEDKLTMKMILVNRKIIWSFKWNCQLF